MDKQQISKLDLTKDMFLSTSFTIQGILQRFAVGSKTVLYICYKENVSKLVALQIVNKVKT